MAEEVIILKDLKLVPDKYYDYSQTLRNSKTPIVIDNGSYINHTNFKLIRTSWFVINTNLFDQVRLLVKLVGQRLVFQISYSKIF